MTMIQLQPPLPVVTPKGEGLAHFVIDYGIEHNLQWVVFINETGECWTYQNPQIRACKNITYGRFISNKVDIEQSKYIKPVPCSQTEK